MPSEPIPFVDSETSPTNATTQPLMEKKTVEDSPWPDEPSRRKIVFVLDQDDIEALRYEKGGSDLLLNEEVHILSPLQPQPGPTVQSLVDQGLVAPGAVLVQNPFDKNLYQNESEAVAQFALAKYLHFSTLCYLLGARKVKVEETRRKDQNCEISLSAEGRITGVASGELKKEKKELDSFGSQLSLIDVFEGSEPEVKAATEHLQRTGLLSDASMRGLLDLFQGKTNRIKSRKLRLNLTTEVHKNLKVLAKIHVPRYLSSGNIDYDRKVQEQTEYILTTTVTF